MNRAEWNVASSQARSQYIRAIASAVANDPLLQKFSLRFSHMEKFGDFETGVFTTSCRDEFVYIPQDSATLGFDRNFVLPPRMMDAFKHVLSLYQSNLFSENTPDDAIIAELEKMMSPLRTGNMREMLVEAEYSEYVYSESEVEDTTETFITGI